MVCAREWRNAAITAKGRQHLHRIKIKRTAQFLLSLHDGGDSAGCLENWGRENSAALQSIMDSRMWRVKMLPESIALAKEYGNKLLHVPYE